VTKKRGSAFRRSLSLYPDSSPNLAQMITPVELLQVLFVSAWLEVALQRSNGWFGLFLLLHGTITTATATAQPAALVRPEVKW